MFALFRTIKQVRFNCLDAICLVARNDNGRRIGEISP